MEPICLQAEKCVFLMIDFQEKLIPAITDGEKVALEAFRLLKCADIMKIPVIVTEQYPKGLGSTVASLRPFIKNDLCLSKTSFSCFNTEHFEEMLTNVGRKTVVAFGIESHICLLTTAMDLKKRGYETIVAEGACGSRDRRNHELAMRNLLAAGIGVLPTETVVYQLLGRAGTPEFKALLPFFR